MWEKQKPSLESLKVFSFEAYAKILGLLKKLDKRSEKHIFVGYVPTGCRLWNSTKRKILVAKDVKLEAPAIKIQDVKKNKKVNLRLNKNDEEEEEKDEKTDEHDWLGRRRY